MPAPRSLRTYLIALTVGILLPPLTYGSFLVLHASQREQDAMAASARERARIATAAIDDELTALRGRLFLFSEGVTPQAGDLGVLRPRAREAFDGMTVILTDPDGQEVLNTNTADGEAPRNRAEPARIRPVIETQRPHVGDLTEDSLTGRPAVLISVPIIRDNRLLYVLSLDVSPTLPGILSRLDLPDGWVAAIFDRRGTIIGRNRNPERYIGQIARPAFLERIMTAPEGQVAGLSREGVPLFTAFAHTKLAGWAISVGIPRDILMAPVQRTIWNLVLLGAAALVLASAAAVLIGRRISAPIISLVPLAEAVGRGEPPVPRATGLVEANDVARSLVTASERLLDAAAERTAATDALRESEQKYRAMAAERNALLNRMVVAQEEERKRIARDLHDSLAQYLTALRLKLDQLIGETAETGGPPLESFGEIVALIGNLGQAVNLMAWELRPVALEGLGLQTAVEHYLDEWSERARMPVDVEVNMDGRPLPPAVETTLFRVLQEATANVLRHANASHVGVILRTKGGVVQLIVEDDGKGFAEGGEPARTAAGTRFGLLGIRERLAQVHGELDIESMPDLGTTLFIQIPVDREGRTP